MRKEGEATLKPNQAALIVTYGNTTRKHRPLDRDLFLLGRSPACDVALVSPEVAAVHCILQRSGDGWRIRDCSGGRHATRLNGRPIQEEELHDCDVLQIGAFSFELRLPTVRPTPVLGSTPIVDNRSAPVLKRLQRSRRNLVRLALRLRGRARKSNPLPPTLAELERQAECLRALQRDYQTLVHEYEARLDELEKAEREVCDERAAFERECAERRTRLDRAEYDMVRRQAEMARAPVAQVVPATDAATDDERARILDRRSRELNCFARYLRGCRRQLQEQTPPDSHPREAEHWRQQCEQLQANWAVLEVQFQQYLAEVKAERDRACAEADGLASTVKEAQAIAESLQREIHDRETLLHKLRRQLEQQSSAANLENSGSYERELNAFRLELERDRQEVNEQLCQLQVRQAEMETAAREAELLMSRERAVIARERAEVTRLRDEIRIARDQTAREGGVRERLIRIRSLRQELTGTAPSAPGNQLREDADLSAGNPVRSSVD